MSHALNRDRVFLASILLLAAALRVWTVLVLRNDLRISEPVIDGQLYLESARALAGGSFNPHTVFFQSPLYPLVLSSLVRSTTAVTSTVLGVQILQTILGLGTGVLLFLAARRRAGSAVARIAALLWLLYGPILEMESEVVPTTLLLFLATAALWLWPRRDGVASRPQGSGRHWKPVAFGVVCGLLVVGRGTYALLPVLAFGAWMLGSRRQARPAASGLARQVALVGIGTAVIIAPLSVYQTRAAGQLVLLTPNGGLNLFIGNNPAARGIYSNPPELDIESDFTGTRSASLLAGRTLTIAESSRFWAARSVGFLTQDPGRAAWLLGRKILLYFSPREIPQIENFSRIATDTPPLRVAFLRFGWILPFAVWGAVSGLARRRRRSTQAAETVERWPFVALVVTGWIATIVFFAAARYRIPMVPGFLVLAAIGIVELWRNRRTPGRLLPGTAVIVAVAALLTVLPSYPVARADANSDYLLGLRLSRNGQHEDAIRIFHRALELDPASGEAWHGIGVAMAAQGRLTEATEAYRHALETMPLSTWTYYNLGVCLEQLERFSEAAEAFGAAVSLQPDDANLRYRWGAVLARLGRTADAVEQLESAVRIDSGLQPATALLRRLRAEQEGN